MQFNVHYIEKDSELFFTVENAFGGCITFRLIDFHGAIAEIKNRETVISRCFRYIKEYMKVYHEEFKSVFEQELSYVDDVLPLIESDLHSETIKLYNLLPGLSTMIVCPECNRRKMLWGAIISLNDDHQWSRNSIADWLETLDIDLTFEGEENVTN